MFRKIGVWWKLFMHYLKDVQDGFTNFVKNFDGGFASPKMLIAGYIGLVAISAIIILVLVVTAQQRSTFRNLKKAGAALGSMDSGLFYCKSKVFWLILPNLLIYDKVLKP